MSRDYIIFIVLMSIIGLLSAVAVVLLCLIVRPARPASQKKKGFKAWWAAHKPTKRRLIQVYCALLFNANIKGIATGNIYRGTSKNFCVPGMNCYSCPAAVGACPLGALQNAFAESGTRAPYYVLGILLLLCLMFARTICGFSCPVGLGQDLLYKIRTPKVKKSKFTYVFSYLKYILLAVFVVIIPLMYGIFAKTAIPAFCKYICPAGTLGGGVLLLLHPENASIFGSLGGLFTWKFIVLVVCTVASIFLYRFFCRFLCPLGALYGLFNRIALFGVKLDKSKCTDCGLCVEHCKMDIRHVGDHECINCGECISICPAKAISWKGSKLFVHANAVPAPDAAEDALSHLSSMQTAAVPAAPAAAAENISSNTAAPSAPKGSGTAEAPEASKNDTRPPAKKHTAGFWMQIAAWGLALAVLLGALVYYNFIDGRTPPSPPVSTQYYFAVGSEIEGADRVSFTLQGEGQGVAISGGSGTAEDPYLLTGFYGKYDVMLHEGELSYYAVTIAAESAVTVVAGADLYLDVFWKTEGGETMRVYRYTQEEPSFTLSPSPEGGEQRYGNLIGDLCYDFSLDRIMGEGKFTLSEHRGKIVIINFWATWCGPCVTELPEFERIKEKYGEQVEVVAIHSAFVTADVKNFIESKEDTYAPRTWADWQVDFVQDTGSGLDSGVYTLLGGRNGAYPRTLVLDGEGKIRYIFPGSATYATLEAQVEALL